MASRFARIALKFECNERAEEAALATRPDLMNAVTTLPFYYFNSDLVLPKGEEIVKFITTPQWVAVHTNKNRVLTSSRTMRLTPRYWEGHMVRRAIKAFGLLTEQQVTDLDALMTAAIEAGEKESHAIMFVETLTDVGLYPSVEQFKWVEAVKSDNYRITQWLTEMRKYLGLDPATPRKLATKKPSKGAKTSVA